jgi:hypothetical protein
MHLLMIPPHCRLMLHRIRWRRKRKSALEQAEAQSQQGGAAEDDDEDDSDDDDEDDEDDAAAGAGSLDALTVSRTGACALVWSGVVPKARFSASRFTFEAVRSEVMARQYLAKLGMESYWDMCRNYKTNTDL